MFPPVKMVINNMRQVCIDYPWFQLSFQQTNVAQKHVDLRILSPFLELNSTHGFSEMSLPPPTAYKV